MSLFKIIDEYKEYLPAVVNKKKLEKIKLELILNIPHDNFQGKTAFQFLLETNNLSCFWQTFPEIKEAGLNDLFTNLSPLSKKEFLYNVVYDKTGGLLNIFNDKTTKKMDHNLQELFNKSLSKQEVIQRWAVQPSFLWSNLSPKLVWAGGGLIEYKLLEYFLKELIQEMMNKQFKCKGEEIIAALSFLRDWQLKVDPNLNNRTAAEVIFKEREVIYNKKLKLLKELNINSDFILTSF